MTLAFLLAGCRPPPVAGEIRGRVVATNGSTVPVAVEGALVHLEGSGRIARTDAQGRFSLRSVPQGTWAIDIRKKTEASERALRVGGIDIGIFQSATQGADLGELVIGGLGEWNGRVTRGGAGVPQARVVVHRVGEMPTDAEGRFLFTSLVPGRHEVSVLLPGGEGLVRVPPLLVSLDAKLDTEVALDGLVPSPSGEVSGYAWLLGRENHAGIRVRIEGSASGAPGTVGVETAGDGLYALGEVPAGVYTLVATAEGFRPVQVPFTIVAGRTVLPPVLLTPSDQPCGGEGSGTPGDDDGDGVPDDSEPAACLCAPGSTDVDGDGMCDHADRDLDADGVDDAVDNCRGVANGGQEDADTDGRGDACDDPAPTCTDGTKNGAESDADCGGGTCPPCADTRGCAVAGDCENGVCSAGTCHAPTCADGVKNGVEVDADCGGGACVPCLPGAACVVPTDCESSVCAEGQCQAASCTDILANGAETDVDCGGGVCAPCGDTRACAAAGDCASGVCAGSVCQAPTCTDLVKNGVESDVDCGGGTCAACADARACKVASDCSSGVCTDSVCRAPTCMDLARNGAETDVDCGGGVCAPCGDTRACAAAGDCASGVCAGSVCRAPTCTDLVKNGAESDADCGGGACAACADARACKLASDCTSGVCTDSVCQAPNCTDLVKNGAESDADCGGGACAPCSDARACKVASDCASGVCTGGVCRAPTCTDLARNGVESDVDCGGGACDPCADARECKVASDCANGVCTGDVCQAATCSDLVKNGVESDADCGGGTCAACADGLACNAAGDCESKVCTGGRCQAPTCADLARNGTETDADCGGDACAPCADGRSCSVEADCVSGVCTGGVCQVPTCADGVQNGAESDLDCGGGACLPCADGMACAVAADCASSVCTGGACQVPTCTDGVVNGFESDADCGGSRCQACVDGLACLSAGDCESGVCLGAECQAPACNDFVTNGRETALDCGGGTCPGCADGLACALPADCASGVCDGAACAVPTCTDSVLNGQEIAADCGGPACPPCIDACSTLICAAGAAATAQHSCEPLPAGPAVTISGTVRLDEISLTPGRTEPEQVSYRVASINSAAVTLTTTPTGLAQGDQVLLINLMGTPAGTDHVGTHEFGRVVAVNGTQVTLARPLRKSYAGAGNLDVAAEVVRLIRVPVFPSLVVEAGATLTARPFDPVTGEGGVLALDVSGEVTFAAADSTISAKQLGYPGGAGGVPASGVSTESNRGFPGTGLAGPASVRGWTPNAGGGGGGQAYRCGSSPEDCGAGGGGGAGRGAGAKGRTGKTNAGLGGVSYMFDEDPRWLMGGGGGGGAADPTGGKERGGRDGVPGGRGGGILFLRAGTVSGPGLVRADGEDVSTLTTRRPHEEGSGGAGAGGTVVLVGAFVTPTTDVTGGVVSRCDYCGGAGGDGRVVVEGGLLASPPTASGSLVSGNPGRWSDGSIAASCSEYRSPPGSLYCAAQQSGVYLVDADQGEPFNAVEVYCDFDAGTESLVCPENYTGNPCAPICNTPCQNGGSCTGPDTCDCSGTGYSGPTCTVPVCTPECEHNGACVEPGVCDCTDTGFSGTRCEVSAPVCPSLATCDVTEYVDATGDCVPFAPGAAALTVNTTVDLSVYKSPGRAYADQVFYRVSSITGSELALAAVPNGIAVGDEVLLINLMGTPAEHAQVGTYELGVVASVGATSLGLVLPPAGQYASSGNADLSAQHVRVVRVPHYDSVTVTGTGILTTSAFGNGVSGSGVLALHSDGDLTLEAGALVKVDGLGYSGGAAGRATSAATGGYIYAGNIDSFGFPGTGRAGPSAVRSTAENFGGGGGGRSYSCGSGDCGSGGGAGAHAANGAAGATASGFEGLGGVAYASGGDGRLYLGSGGGGGGSDPRNGSAGDYASGSPGGAGGGILLVRAGGIRNGGTVSALGANGGNGTSSSGEEGAGGAGSGGSVLVLNASYFGTPATAGGIPGTGCGTLCGGAGGAGRTLSPDAVRLTGLKTLSDPGTWSDGSLALSCIEYVSCSTGGAGVYLVDPDGGEGAEPYLVQCAADGTMTRI